MRLHRLLSGGTALLRVAVVALAAHAVVYHALFPSGAAHGYFGWYAPLVAVASGVALLSAVLVVLATVTGIGGSRVRRLALASEPSADVSGVAARLAMKAVAFLAVQETLERSIPARSVELVQFTPLQWLVALSATACVALVLVCAGRGCQVLVRRLRTPRGATPTRGGARCLPIRSVALVAWPPLASFSGLRAPPPLTSA